jgi:hypothetical protein
LVVCEVGARVDGLDEHDFAYRFAGGEGQAVEVSDEVLAPFVGLDTHA